MLPARGGLLLILPRANFRVVVPPSSRALFITATSASPLKNFGCKGGLLGLFERKSGDGGVVDLRRPCLEKDSGFKVCCALNLGRRRFGGGAEVEGAHVPESSNNRCFGARVNGEGDSESTCGGSRFWSAREWVGMSSGSPPSRAACSLPPSAADVRGCEQNPASVHVYSKPLCFPTVVGSELVSMSISMTSDSVGVIRSGERPRFAIAIEVVPPLFNKLLFAALGNCSFSDVNSTSSVSDFMKVKVTGLVLGIWRRRVRLPRGRDSVD